MQLNSDLDVLTAHIRELNGILGAEHGALLDPDWQTLTELSQQKRLVLEKLGGVDERFRARLTQTLVDDLHEPHQVLKEYVRRDRTLRVKLQQLSCLLWDCQRLNRENHRLVLVRLRQTSQLLDLFAECGLSCRAPLYGSSGHTVPYTSGRDLATA
ncbi:MAG: flagellar export chaperone FlgN [Gammaproteobacteria bacterium]